MAKKFEAELRNLIRPRTSGATGETVAKFHNYPNFISKCELFRKLGLNVIQGHKRSYPLNDLEELWLFRQSKVTL